MSWFYVSNNQQQGPVADAELDELVRSGAVRANTLVWRNGMAEWQPLHLVRPTEIARPLASPGAAAPTGSGICAECGRLFPATEMVRLNQSWVCAGCKPMFLQRMAEGVAPASLGTVWRSGRQVLVGSDTAMPDACVRCNAPANGFRLKRKLYWHSPYYYLLILVSLLIYVIVAVIVRKKAVVEIGLCEQHRKRRINFIIGGWVGVVAGIGLLVAGIYANTSGMMILAGIVVALVAAVVGISQAGVVSAAKIEKDTVWLKGAGSVFLASLPQWPGGPA